MGKARKAMARLACGECNAKMYDPCVHKTSGKPLKSFHSSRRIEGRNDHLNREMERIEGETQEFWQFCWLALGLQERTYPEKSTPDSWRALYAVHKEYDPSDGYFGEW